MSVQDALDAILEGAELMAELFSEGGVPTVAEAAALFMSRQAESAGDDARAAHHH
jgi:hypothetical protein